MNTTTEVPTAVHRDIPRDLFDRGVKILARKADRQCATFQQPSTTDSYMKGSLVVFASVRGVLARFIVRDNGSLQQAGEDESEAA